MSETFVYDDGFAARVAGDLYAVEEDAVPVRLDERKVTIQLQVDAVAALQVAVGLNSVVLPLALNMQCLQS